MKGSFTAVEAILDERAKHPSLLLGAVEERADMTLSAQRTPGKLYGLMLGSHVSPHRHEPSSAPGCGWVLGSSIQSGANALEQQFVVERLCQELHGAAAHCLHPHACVTVGGNEDRRNPDLLGVQPRLQVETGQARHPNIRDETSGVMLL